MKKLVIIFALYLLFFSTIQIQVLGDVRCFTQPCPIGTSNCKKHTKTSPDKRLLDITISCLNDYDGSMKDYYFQENNFRNPYTYYERTSYSPVEENYL